MERLKLKVLEVKEREKVGKNQIDKLSFKASLGDGEGAWYFTFKTSLFEVIEAKGEIDAEVDISEREYDSNTYVDRKITQIYKDGQPIGGQKKGQWGKSPEAVHLEVEGRYRNTALMQAVELVKYDKLSIEAILSKADLFYKWLAGDKPAVKVTTMEVVKQAEKDIKDLWPEEQHIEKQVAEQVKESEPKTIQALYNWISKHGKHYTRSWFLKTFSFTEEELRQPEKISNAYYEVKEMMNWT